MRRIITASLALVLLLGTDVVLAQSEVSLVASGSDTCEVLGFWQQMTVSPQTSTVYIAGTCGAFMHVAAYDSNLVQVWRYAELSTPYPSVSSIVRDAGDTLYVAYLSGSSNDYRSAAVLLKISPEGELVWRRTHVATYQSAPFGYPVVRLDSTGGIYLLFAGELPEQPRALSVVRYSRDGIEQWARLLGTVPTRSFDAHVAPSGRLRVTYATREATVSTVYTELINADSTTETKGLYGTTAGEHRVIASSSDADDRLYLFLRSNWQSQYADLAVMRTHIFSSLDWHSELEDVPEPVEAFMRADPTGNIYTVTSPPLGNTSAGIEMLRLIDRSGNELWRMEPDESGDRGHLRATHGVSAMEVGFDEDVYLAGLIGLDSVVVERVTRDRMIDWRYTRPFTMTNFQFSYPRPFEIEATVSGAVIVASNRTPGQAGPSYLQLEKLRWRTTTAVDDNAVSTGRSGGTRGTIHPNPTTGDAQLTLDLARAGDLTIDLLAVTGEHVAQLVREHRAAGEHRVAIPVRSLDLPSGPYFVRVTTGDEIRTMILHVME